MINYAVVLLLGSSLMLLACGESDSVLGQEKAALEARVEQLAEALESSQDDILKVSGERDQALATVEILNDLTAQRDEAQGQVEVLQAQLAEVQTELNGARERESQLNLSMSTTLEEFELVRNELEALKGQLVNNSMSDTERETLIEQLQREKTAVSAELEILQSELLNLQRENRQLRSELGFGGELGNGLRDALPGN